MDKIIYLFIIIAIAAGLSYLNPRFEDHKLALSPDIEIDAPVWDGLQFKDYFVVSFTSDTAIGGSMVSYGLCNYVKVVDEEWVTNRRKKSE